MDLQATGRHARDMPVPENGGAHAGLADLPDLDPTAAPVRVRRERKRGPWRRFKRFVRRHKALSIIFMTALVLLAILIGWLLWLNHKLDDIDRFPFEPGGQRPAKVGTAENILLIGVDDPDGKGGLFEDLSSGTWTPGKFRSDAIMVLHISGDRKSAQLVSIPRDSFVDVPGRGRDKINASFSDGGPSELAEVVESLSDIRIDHAVVIDFEHLADMTDALGGIDVYQPEDITDPRNNYTWQKGPLHLEGEKAVWYVRQRYGMPREEMASERISDEVKPASTSTNEESSETSLVTRHGRARVPADAVLSSIARSTFCWRWIRSKSPRGMP